ncbi:hypothetical protein YYC_00074 [Plasmodium yoelii 17X]|nr:hypothetical protein YYC_00074 [Plasmodium yoelii 17X]
MAVEVMFVEPTFGLGLCITLHLIFYNFNTNLIYVSSRIFNQKMKLKNTNIRGSILNSLLNYLNFYNKIIMDVTNNHKLYYTSDQNVLNISNLRQLSSYQKKE